MSLLFPHFWRILDMKFWVVSGVFFGSPPSLTSISEMLFCILLTYMVSIWEIHSHSNCCSLCNVLFFSGYFEDYLSSVFSGLIMVCWHGFESNLFGVHWASSVRRCLTKFESFLDILSLLPMLYIFSLLHLGLWWYEHQTTDTWDCTFFFFLVLLHLV